MLKNHAQRLAELISGIESVMFTTINPDGSVNSRPMIVQDFEFDGELWFFTHRSSSKVDSIVEDSHVCIAFMDPGSNRYVNVSGTAEVIDNPWTIKKIWSDAFERWFPEGHADEDLALIRVQVTHAEHWDAPHSELVESFCFTAETLSTRSRETQQERLFHSW